MDKSSQFVFSREGFYSYSFDKAKIEESPAYHRAGTPMIIITDCERIGAGMVTLIVGTGFRFVSEFSIKNLVL